MDQRAREDGGILDLDSGPPLDVRAWNLQFEWDPKKALANAKKHRVGFDEAATVFYDPLSATFDDLDHSQGEARMITVGYSVRNRLLVVAHTERGAIVRIISARPATVHERKKHEE